MKKVKKLVLLLLCLSFSGAFCYAHGVTGTENENGDGIPIEIKECNGVSGSDKSSSIQATINGHYLTIVFLENLGQVLVEVNTYIGGEVETTFVETPDGLCIYIPNTGNFIVTFTLPNGDEYYGEFVVID